jgi:Ankyrin repeats (3 copies)/Ankyrin repeats (many copies)
MRFVSMRFVMAILVVAGLSGFALPSWADNSAALVTAATKGDIAAAKSLLAAGADSNSHDTDGYSALNWAAYHGHLDIAKLLIDQGADVNAHGNPKRWTPLMNAAGMGHDDVAKLLVSRGADVNVLDATGAQALLWARAKARSSLMSYLLAHGAAPLPELGTEYGSPQSCYMRQGDHILLTGHIKKLRPSDPPIRPGQLPWIDAPACPEDSFILTTTGAFPASCQAEHPIRFSGTISRTLSVHPGKIYTVNTQSAACD